MRRERGVALVMALIFSILLYILVAELVVASRMVRATGENDALLGRMRTQMRFQLLDAEDQLLQDMQGAGAEGGGAGGLAGAAAAAGAGGAGATSGAGAAGGAGGAGGANPLAGAGGAGGAPGEGGEEDPSANCDSSRDAWFEPIGHADNDLTTYVWIEDENRKLNILALWSPDQDFANASRERLVRLIDALREDTEFDVPSTDALRIVQELVEWGERPSTEMMPKPKLKSEKEDRRELAIPLHLDELMMLPSVTPDLFFDKVLDGHVYQGLESVLTLWTSLNSDPGDPEKVARQRAAATARGETPPEAPGASSSGSGGSSSQGQGQGQGSTPGSAGNAGSSPGSASGSGTGPNGQPAPPTPDGIGIRINVNTASRAVLRSLFPTDKIPDRVIDAIIRYRNEVDEEATQAAADKAGSDLSSFGSLRLGEQQKYKFFATTADLENIEEFANLADQDIKTEFQNALTTKSEVFSIHLATLYKRSEENRVYLLRRARSIVLRYDDGGDGKIIPLIPFEERVGLRLQPVDKQDLPDAVPLDFSVLYSNMDQFAQEDRAWNPFLVDFYLPKHVRENFYQPR